MKTCSYKFFWNIPKSKQRSKMLLWKFDRMSLGNRRPAWRSVKVLRLVDSQNHFNLKFKNNLQEILLIPRNAPSLCGISPLNAPYFFGISTKTVPDISGFSPRNAYYTFLDASTYLYKRVCPSVRPSVRLSVGPSVRRSVRRSVGPSVRNAFFKMSR